MERLQKVIANHGYCSRRKAEELIVFGKVKVNGKVVTELGVKVNPNDLIEVNGVSLTHEEYVYYLLNKPKAYLSSASDDRGRQCVTELITENDKRIYPVGRLDYNTSGLIILTNDGEFANMMTHPKFGIAKKYRVRCKGRVTGLMVKELESGILIDGYKTKPAVVKVNAYDKTSHTSDVYITIYEGRNQQIKKMFLSIGCPVRQLKRIEYGFLKIEHMPIGSYRVLTAHEIKQLYNLAQFGKVGQ